MSTSMFCLLAIVISGILLSSADIRPIWNIGHMVNSLEQIDEFLNLGANALETDFTFFDNGTAEKTYHGFPCDCFRVCTKHEEIDRYLSYVREVTSPDSPKFRKHFILLMIDLKISSLSNNSKRKAGEDIALRIIRLLWSGSKEKSQVFIVLSFPYSTDSDFVIGFLQALKDNGYENMEDKIGWDMSGNEELDVIKAEYNKLGITRRVWQADGITNCLPHSISRLIKAIKKRDQDPEWEFLSKVYYWTIDKKTSMRKVLSVGVDGIISNHPDRLVEVLKENDFLTTHQLANITDNPWEKIRGDTEFDTRDKDYIFYDVCNETEIVEGVCEN